MKRHLASGIATIFAAVTLIACPFFNTDEKDAPDLEITLTESQSERRLERFDANGVLESWNYDRNDTLIAYSVYEYDGTVPPRLMKVRIYSDDDPADASTCILVAEYVYEDANADYATSGMLCVFDPATGSYDTAAPLERFEAAYNGNGDYVTMTYYQRDGGAEIVEQHRTCTYDANGYYAVESYYAGADAADADLLERYTATYDATDTWKCIQEVRYLKIPTADPSYTYVRTLTYKYSWDADDNMYLQAEFDEDGNLTGSILQTYELLGDGYWYRKTRGSLTGNGLNALYRTYEYDATNLDLIEIRYYNKNNDEETELLARDSYKYFIRDDGSGSDQYFYENTYFVYDYSSRGLMAGDRSLESGERNGLALPPSSHHLLD